MLKTVLFVVLTATLAQVPSCGGGDTTEGTGVVGWVEAKRIDQSNHAYLLVINSAEYEVPGYFYRQVEVGDLVKWDGATWTIVKKRNASSGVPPVSFFPRRSA